MRMEAVTEPNLAERIYHKVRKAILAGELEPGAPIRQDAMAAQLGVSKIPVREALARLEGDGLVVLQSRRGYVVSPVSVAECMEIFSLRLVLEPSATAEGAAAAGPAQRELAKEALGELEVATANNEPLVVLNRRFHLAMITPGAGPLTLSMLERLLVLSERYVGLHLAPEGRSTRAYREHRSILGAWLKGDLARVASLVRHHVDQTRADLLNHMASRPPTR